MVTGRERNPWRERFLLQEEIDSSHPDNLDISDPITCGEDLVYNARRAMELARKYCGECGDYHALHPARRAAGTLRKLGTDADRPRLFKVIAQLLNTQRKSGSQLLDIVIAGSVDTGLLATCAHAVFSGQLEVEPSIRFTVLDRCRTPLELCRDYAARHKLNLNVEVVDFLTVENVYPADIVFQHGLLRFLPVEQRAPTLRKFGSWLKPNGRLLSVTSTVPPEMKDYIAARRLRDFNHLWREAERGAIAIDEPLEVYYDRIKRSLGSNPRGPRFENPNMVLRLFADAGMEVCSVERFHRIEKSQDVERAYKTSVISVLKPARND